MPSSWFGKKEPGDASAPFEPQPDAAAAAGEFRELVDQLGQAEKLLGEIGRRMTEYLIRRESQPAEESAPAALEATLAALAEKLDRLDARLASPADSGRERGEPSGPASGEILAAIGQQGTVVRDLLSEIEGRLEKDFEKLLKRIGPAEERPQESPPQKTAAWENAILGPDLAADSRLAFKRQELIDGMLAGDAGARWLAGQLLTFQSAPAERLPQLLKEIGEAYYRWQPKTAPGTNPFEDALVRWLQKRCEAAGISNTIELVHPGERFDASRHNASSRGVEITAAHGWIVLRDNGKVYTKAAVAVK